MKVSDLNRVRQQRLLCGDIIAAVLQNKMPLNELDEKIVRKVQKMMEPADPTTLDVVQRLADKSLVYQTKNLPLPSRN